MTVQITAVGTKELYQRFADDPLSIYKDAYRSGRNLSGWLEMLSPTEQGELDAFSRMMREAGIVRRSIPMAGIWASPAGDFLQDEGRRALFQEFCAREWRKVAYMTPQQRATYLSSDGTAGSWERPYVDAQDPRWSEQIAPAIPLSAIIAMTTPIDGADYRSIYLTYDATQLRQFRVGESAEIPVAKLATSENTIQLHKYGRALEASYEAMRRMRVDKLARQVALMAVQSEVDKVAAAVDVLLNGDGNTNTAAENFNLTTLDSGATAGTLTLKGWLAFKLKFANPYMLTTAIVQEAVALQLLMLSTGNANIPLVNIQAASGFGGFRQINPGLADNVALGWTSDAPSLKVVAFDQRFALENVTEIGSNISETERFIRNQTTVMTMTEVQGFAVLDPEAAKTLDVNA